MLIQICDNVKSKREKTKLYQVELFETAEKVPFILKKGDFEEPEDIK